MNPSSNPQVNQSNNSRKPGRRYDLECQRLQIKIAQEKISLAELQSSVMSGDCVRAKDEVIRQAVKKALDLMPSLIPQIQGKDASAMVTVFDSYAHKTLTNLSDPTSDLWKGIR